MLNHRPEAKKRDARRVLWCFVGLETTSRHAGIKFRSPASLCESILSLQLEAARFRRPAGRPGQGPSIFV